MVCRTLLPIDKGGRSFENKVMLRFVEVSNNQIRVIQRRTFGLRDEEYLRLKILACRLPKIVE